MSEIKPSRKGSIDDVLQNAMNRLSKYDFAKSSRIFHESPPIISSSTNHNVWTQPQQQQQHNKHDEHLSPLRQHHQQQSDQQEQHHHGFGSRRNTIAECVEKCFNSDNQNNSDDNKQRVMKRGRDKNNNNNNSSPNNSNHTTSSSSSSGSSVKSNVQQKVRFEEGSSKGERSKDQSSDQRDGSMKKVVDYIRAMPDAKVQHIVNDANTSLNIPAPDYNDEVDCSYERLLNDIQHKFKLDNVKKLSKNSELQKAWDERTEKMQLAKVLQH